MIYKSTKLKWINLNAQSSGNNSSSESGTIEELFQEYSHLMYQYQGYNNSVYQIISMTNDSCVYVVDQYGWTELLGITKGPIIPYDFGEKWMRITTEYASIIVADRALIPVYNLNDDPEIGFHGEKKYKYILHHAAKISVGDILKHNISTDREFGRVIDISYNDIPNVDGYFIYTKSSKVIVDDIYLHAGNSISIDEAKAMFDKDSVIVD